MALDSKTPRELELPSREQHRELLRRSIVQAWITGHQLADEELLADQRQRLGQFMGSDPPATPKPAPGPPPSAAIDYLRGRDVLLGKWDRDLDAEVTRVLVHALETGASKKKIMRALAVVFEDFSKHRLENIARTETSAALTQGRLARFREPGSNVVGVQFVAIMDARTTRMCQARDGMMMRLDDERLAANTPPLHFMCRSTLVAITDWVWADLEAGDERALKRWFGWLKHEQAPHDLASALGGWDTAPAPLKGFGTVGSGPIGKTPALPKPVVPKPRATGPELKNWIDERKKLGIDDIDDVRDVGRRVLSDVRSRIADSAPGIEKEVRAATKVLQQAQREANISRLILEDIKANPVPQGIADQVEESAKAAATNLADAVAKQEQLWVKLAITRSEAVSEVLAQVRPQGGIGQKWAPRTAVKARESVARASIHYPRDWLQASADFGTIQGKEARRGFYGHPVRASSVAELAVRKGSGPGQQYKTALHEMAHRFEYVVPDLGRLAQEYLGSRTVGEKAEKLRNLIPGSRYKPREVAKKDKFTHPYFGKQYDDATEIMPMGMEAVFLSEYNVWEEDISLLEFVIGALAAL